MTETRVPGVSVVDDHADTFGVPPDVYHRRWLILGVLCISLVVIVISVSSLNVALPTIQGRLGASGTQLQWIVDGYALVFAGLLLPAGAIGDRFGRKGALQTGLVIFGLAALAASRASSPAELIAFRAVMGVGAALIMPSTLSIVVNSFPFAERPKAIALWAAFAGVGGALGPISSGLLLEHFWWGSVFFANVPLVLVLLVLSALIVPSSKDPNGHALDPIGAVLSVVGLVSLVFAVIEGPELGWSAPATIGGFVIAVIALFAFVRYERRKRNPMLDPALFRSRGFSTGSATVTLAFFNMFGLFFLLSQYLQFVKAYSPLAAGVRVLPSAFTLMLVSPQGPRLVGRFGVRAVITAGFASAAGGFALMSFANRGSSYLLVAVALVLAAAGIALLMPPASQLIVGSVPLSKAGVGSAVNDVTREVGGALGIAVVGSIVNSVYRARDTFSDSIADPAARDAARKSVGQALAAGRRALDRGLLSSDQFHQLTQAAGSAFNDGTRIALIVLTGVSAVSAVVLGRLVPNELPSRQVPSMKP
jgi:EmrB/QacA subfamily drug resistance transporter